jgi:uncharacterized protein (DUF58 family)
MLGSIDQKFIREAIAPPAELVPYLKGKKFETETVEERRRIIQISHEWAARLAQALKRKSVTLQEVLDVIPEPYRTGVIEALIKYDAKRKS